MWEATLAFLTRYDSIALWLEGVAFIAIFVLELKEYNRQGKDRVEQHRETLAQMELTERQATAARESAESAILSAKSLINSQRAWLMVDIEWDGRTQELSTVIGEITEEKTTIGLACMCRNHGKTPAWITERRIRFEIVDFVPGKPTLERSELLQAGPEPLSAGRTYSFYWQGECDGRIESSKMGIIYGIVKYRDIFYASESDLRTTTFGYKVHLLDTLVGKKLERLSSYPEYNRNT